MYNDGAVSQTKKASIVGDFTPDKSLVTRQRAGTCASHLVVELQRTPRELMIPSTGVRLRATSLGGRDCRCHCLLSNILHRTLRHLQSALGLGVRSLRAEGIVSSVQKYVVP